MPHGKRQKSIWGRGGARDGLEQGLPDAEIPLRLREGWGCGGAGSLHGLFPKLLCCP